MYIIAIAGSMCLLLICLVKRHPSKKILLQIYSVLVEIAIHSFRQI
jgi:hypothetical protein